MLALKIIAAVLCLATTLLKFGLDYRWKDKRTTEHKRKRTAFLLVALIAGLVTSVTVLFDYWQSSSASAEQREKLRTIEDFSAGGLSPEIFVELYIGPNHPTPPRMSLTPEFPGIVVVWVENKSDYPIYDLDIFMIHFKSEGGESKTAAAFNQPLKKFEILKARETLSFQLPADLAYRKDKPMVSFDFFTSSRRGASKHLSRFYLSDNQWEYARQSTDLGATNVLVREISSNYPRDSKGEPIWY